MLRYFSVAAVALTVSDIFLLTSLSAHAQDKANNSSRSPPAFTVSGYAEAYYSFGLDSFGLDRFTPGRKPSFLVSYDRNNEPSINLALIKGSYMTNNARANLALAAGSYMSANYAAEPEALRNIYESNIGIKLSGKNNLWLDAGVFASHIGFESAVGKDNWILTRSIGADNTPYFETGAKISYTSESEKWFLSALLLNGWQHIKPIEGNSIPSFGTQVMYKPSSKLTLNSSTFIGSDKPDNARKMRYFHNFYGIYKLNDKFAVMTGFDIGIEQKDRNSSDMNTWFNPEAMLRYTPTAKIAIAARVEYYDDKHGVIIASSTPHGFKTWGFSTNFDYKITSNILWRIEARTLRSKDNIFTRSDGSTADSSLFMTTSLSASF